VPPEPVRVLPPTDTLREAVERAQLSRASRAARLADYGKTVWHELLQPALATRQGRIAVRAAAAILALAIGIHAASSLLQSATSSVFHPLSERAYYLLEDDFRGSFGAWTAPDVLSRREDGLMEAKGLALYHPSLPRRDYEFAFSGLILDGAMGWVVRAADPQNFYAFKLTWQGKGKDRRSVLTRYPVLGGVPAEKPQSVALPFELERNKLYQVAVDVAGERITTMINGRGVDSCSNSKLSVGGIGFFAEAGETGAIHSLSMSGNDDSTGRLLQWLKGFYQFLTNKK
jgi:hypothetical protein